MRHPSKLILSSFLACPLFAQNTIFSSPQFGEILGSVFGDAIPRATGFSISALDSSGSEARVKFKLDRVVPALDALLVVSPSSGTTPLHVTVGLNPKVVGLAN